MKIEQKIDNYLKEETKISNKILYKSEQGEKGYFVVVERDTKGMNGTQDEFSMYVVDEKMNIKVKYGSHPLLKGAIKFGVNKDYLEPEKK